MKFLKKSQVNFRNVKDNSIAIQVDGEVTLDSPSAVLVPRGQTSERPTTSVTSDLNGMIRYNSQTGEFEGRQGDVWRSFRFKETTQITSQNLGSGDDVELYFGLLDPAPPSTVATGVTWGAQNILVFVENVPQLSELNNYSIVQLDGTETGAGYPGAPYAAGWYVKFDTPVPFGKPVTAIQGFDR